MVGKVFIYDNEEWEVEEVLLYGKRCECRSYYSDRTKQFYCDFVQGQIANYKKDLEEKNKNENAIVFKEENEKELLRKIVAYYKDNVKLSEMNEDEFEVISKIIKKIK